MRSLWDGQANFDYRLGAGGAIAEMRDVRAGNRRLLSPSYAGETTDRIIQWTWWSETIRYEGTSLRDFEKRFNTTQGGDFSGAIAPTVAVEYCPIMERVDVYSVPQDQWKVENAKAMQSEISALTRYEMLDGGILKIRRIMHVGSVSLSGNPMQFEELYIEGWSPFDRSETTFDALALALDDSGPPTWWYRAGDIPHYPKFSVSITRGYAVVYAEHQAASRPVIGLIFGKKQPVSPEKRDHYVLNLMDWNNGIGILPALRLHHVQEGSIIDQVLYVVPASSMTRQFHKTLVRLVEEIPPPTLYAPDHHFSGELKDLVLRLIRQRGTPGVRTEHLGTLLSPAPSKPDRETDSLDTQKPTPL